LHPIRFAGALPAFMKITLLGAAGGEVTGSCYLVQTDRARVLIDCGLFQGGKNTESLNVPPLAPGEKLDAVLLTHAHLDHTGRLPLLTKAGYGGPIYATPATLDLTGLILRDAARLQVADTQRENRKRMRAGEPLEQPIFTPDDVEQTLARLQPVPYQTPVSVAPGISAIWAESGHMLGSASIQLQIEERGRTKRVVFSGDIGPKCALILRDFEPFRQADLVFLESTYGSRDHRSLPETIAEFERIVVEAVASRGKILVPTFAVGRAQLITLLLSQMFHAGKIPAFPIYLDSPMAIEAARIYASHPELLDEETLRYLRTAPGGGELPMLRATATAEESRAINEAAGPCLVLAGAGMCNAGRILHHLKANLWKPGTHVVIVGYQGEGSLGRRLVDGEKLVSIFGEKIAVKAKIHTLGGFSAHAGQRDLLNWFGVMARSQPRVMLTHGAQSERVALARALQQRHRARAALPALGETLDL
jgi:metallo-beta-lactamase family protein